MKNHQNPGQYKRWRRVALLALLAGMFSGCVVLVPFLPEDRPGSEELFAGYGAPLRAGAPDGLRRGASRRARPNQQAKIRALITKLSDSKDVVRVHAASDLGSYGPKAAPALDALAHALRHDSSKWVRRAAAKALGKIGGAAAREALSAALGDRDRYVAHSAERALRRIAR